MSRGDRIFWGVILFFLVTLLWLKFIESFVPMWGSVIIGGLAAFCFIKFIPGEKRK